MTSFKCLAYMTNVNQTVFQVVSRFSEFNRSTTSEILSYLGNFLRKIIMKLFVCMIALIGVTCADMSSVIVFNENNFDNVKDGNYFVSFANM